MTAIAQEVISKNKKAVFIAGPSSSGKTTSSNRLSVQLKTHGYNAHPIACDDYFINREDIPFDENGKQNFETFSVLDTKTLERDVLALLAGETVELPKFNFITGKREYNGKTLTLGEKDILVIEGIHCLNPNFLPNVDAYKMYVSALPVLNLDGHNYISSSNSRLLRRIARDASHRGTNAQKTISMWKSVRAGEEENIFPYQENADVIFNSSLIYELPVIKTVAEPLLFAVDRDSEEWATAKTLLKFLDFFLGYPGNEVPTNSVLREFMGGSCFDVG
jgi:uridine kinase